MKNLIIILALLFVSLLQTPLLAVNDKSETDAAFYTPSVVNIDIIQALKEADVNKISRYFSEIIDFKLPEREEMRSVSRSQASITLKTFFDSEKISGFNLISQRELGSTKYIAGKLQGSRDYNITVMIKESGGRDNIITVRIN